MSLRETRSATLFPEARALESCLLVMSPLATAASATVASTAAIERTMPRAPSNAPGRRGSLVGGLVLIEKRKKEGCEKEKVFFSPSLSLLPLFFPSLSLSLFSLSL